MHIRLSGRGKAFLWLVITVSIHLNPLGLLKWDASGWETLNLRGKHLPAGSQVLSAEGFTSTSQVELLTASQLQEGEMGTLRLGLKRQ